MNYSRFSPCRNTTKSEDTNVTKTKFVLFDTDAKLYIKKPYGYEETANAGKPGNAFATSALTAKSWSRIHWARETGSLRNTSRRFPDRADLTITAR
jgi:hypothetical protein